MSSPVKMHYDNPAKAAYARRLVAAGMGEPQAVAVSRRLDRPDEVTFCKELIEVGFTRLQAETIASLPL